MRTLTVRQNQKTREYIYKLYDKITRGNKKYFVIYNDKKYIIDVRLKTKYFIEISLMNEDESILEMHYLIQKRNIWFKGNDLAFQNYFLEKLFKNAGV